MPRFLFEASYTVEGVKGLRRQGGSGRREAVARAALGMLFLGTQLPTLQQALLTTTLSPSQWLICAGLAALLPVVVEISKAIRRRRAPKPDRVDVQQAVSPERAH
jgi:P-type Ca2+ transporter type 2C